MSPALRSRWRTWNHGCAIWTPRSLASLLRAMHAPSLFDSTTTGRSTSAGLNTRSQLTYMLLTSTSAYTARCSDRQGLDHRGHDTPDPQVFPIARDDVGHCRVAGAQAEAFLRHQ